MSREHWGSKLGFILAVAGSAIGLGNIWRFPYIAGNNGGAAFILVYLVCLLAIGFPVFIAEITMGRRAQTDPAGTFRLLGRTGLWGGVGMLTIVTGCIVSAFYSAVAGWVLGYFVEALKGSVVQFTSHEQAVAHYQGLLESPWWGIGYHALFLFSSLAVLYCGVKEGIERCNKFFMPLLFVILIILVLRGFFLPNSFQSLGFLLQPDWSLITPGAFLIALGQSFFTLSVGQGTLVTYGSYLSSKENIVQSGLMILLMDTLVSILSAFAIFTIVFSVGIRPDQGPSLLFNTLPLVFSQIAGGYIMSVLFFLLIVIAALTSEISALEPLISYLSDKRGWTRTKAVCVSGGISFLIGVPCALSTSVLKDISFLGQSSVLEGIIFLCSDILIPIGGLAAVILAGWRWGLVPFFEELNRGGEDSFASSYRFKAYLGICVRFVSPVLIIVVFLSAIGFFG